jgi:hypothetical protein
LSVLLLQVWCAIPKSKPKPLHKQKWKQRSYGSAPPALEEIDVPLPPLFDDMPDGYGGDGLGRRTRRGKKPVTEEAATESAGPQETIHWRPSLWSYEKQLMTDKLCLKPAIRLVKVMYMMHILILVIIHFIHIGFVIQPKYYRPFCWSQDIITFLFSYRGGEMFGNGSALVTISLKL